jgi:preprotein translocase subunit SecY
VLTAILNAFRLPELRNKLLITLALLGIYRLFAEVSIPGANQGALNQLFAGQPLIGLLNLFSGGGLASFSIVALGVNPYINASIIMQLMTVVSTRIKEISKEGEQGRRRITRWTRYLTVALAFGQGYGITVLFQNTSPAILPADMQWFQRISIMIVMTGGTIMAMWLGELISEHGIGNGISLIIFAGILARAPSTVQGLIQGTGNGGLVGYLPVLAMAVVAVAAVASVIEVQQATRKIPIQSAQRLSGGRTVQGRQSNLPLKVNTAGVIPIIFAISVLEFPTIIASYLQGAAHSTWYYQAAQWITQNFQPTGANTPVVVGYNVLEFLLVFGFTYFYTAVTYDVNDVADNLRRLSSFVPGIRPGPPTAEYLGRVLNRITFAGGLFLGVITVLLPVITAKVTSIPESSTTLGGTAILIVVGVALDTMRQLETQLVMRQYRGFIR